jgi:zeaxanthin glucosyltransferase
MQYEGNNQPDSQPKKRVVFLCYHGFGHINPCFPLATILRQRGHEITFATAAYFNEYVRRAGYSHYPLKSVPFGLGFESWVNAEARKRLLYLASLRDRFSDRLYHERERELSTLLNDVRPDVILIDATQATDFIVLFHEANKRGVAIAMLHAMFPTHVLPRRPPVNSHVIPGNDREEKKALKQMRWKLHRTDLKQRLAYFGMSDRYLIARRIRMNKIPATFQLATPSLFDFQVAHLPTFVLAPREFDFPDFTVPENHWYIGFRQHTSQSHPHEKWAQAKKSIKDRKASGARVIYCSFGTVNGGDETLAHAFLMRLADGIAQQGDLLIISMGGRRTIPAGLERSNVLVFHFVPQTEVLQCCDVFVTHGGLSSINEAIEALVPMLVVTVHYQFDPPGNAARVEFHGLGIRGNMNSDSQQLIRQLNTLTGNGQFKTRLKHFREKNAAYTPERFLSVFDSL